MVSNADRWGFEQLRATYELYARIQVDSDTIYYYRASVITLAQGFLLLVLQSVVSGARSRPPPAVIIAIAATGALLSVFWFFFEQRNQAYFSARAEVLRGIEGHLLARSADHGIPFEPLFTQVPEIVKRKASRRQRVSAPFIQRTLVPLLFAALWVTLGIISPTFKHEQAPDHSCLAVSLASNGGDLTAAQQVCQQIR